MLSGRSSYTNSVLTHAEFGGDHDAYLAYVITRPDSQAVAELKRVAREDGIHDFAAGWLRAAWVFSDRGAWPAEQLGELALELIEGDPVAAYRELVCELAQFVRLRCPRLIPRLLAWLESAEPGDGLVVAQAMVGFLVARRSREDLAPFGALAQRLLEVHGAVLRDRRFVPLVFWILDVVRHHSPKHLGAALRYLAVSEGVWTVSYVDPAESAEIFWSAVERYLEEGGDEALVGDVFGHPGAAAGVSVKWLFAPMEESRYPRARAALAQALCQGRVSRNELHFRHVLSAMPPRARLESGCWAPLAAALRWQQKSNATLDAWAEYCAREWFRIHGLRRSQELTQLAAHPPLQRGFRKALEAELIANPEPHGLTRRLLEDPDDALVWPALAALETPTAIRRVDEGTLERVRYELMRFINLPWLNPVGGLDVARLVGGCQTVVFEPLPSGDKVCIDGPKMSLDRDSISGVLRALPNVEAVSGALVYAVHELVHLPQGLQAMRTVTQLREAGAETTLLHLDLSADHVTALLLHELDRSRSVTDLKRLEGDMLALFPVSRFHTPGSAERKLRRLVSLRADYLLRRERRLPDVCGYVFVDFGESAGPIAFLASGPPHRVLCVGQLQGATADALRAAARALDISAVDSIVEEALRGAELIGRR